MNNALEYFLTGIFYLFAVVMYYAGFVDDAASSFMASWGIYPPYQLYVFLVITAALVVLALRWLGGLPGWVVLLLLVILLLHRIVPEVSNPGPLVLHPLMNTL
jgi:hypothetical protein